MSGQFTINKNIQDLYNKSGFFDRYGSDIIITIVLLIVFIYLIIYFSIVNNIQSLKTDWENKKCNPAYMPFAGIINNTSADTSNFQYSLNNFNNCIQEISKEAARDAMKPVNDLVDEESAIFAAFNNIFKSLIGYFAGLLDSIREFMEKFYNALLNGSVEFSKITIKMKDIFGKLIGSLVATMYSQILLMQITFIWIVQFPVISGINLLIGNLITMLGSIVLYYVMSAMASGFSAVPFLIWLGLIFANIANSTILPVLIFQILICTVIIIFLAVFIPFTNSILAKIRVQGIPNQFI